MNEAEKLANEHWAFLQRREEMTFKDGFIHGYKHGQADAATVVSENMTELMKEFQGYMDSMKIPPQEA